MSIPKHVAIIPDGNRRWARSRGLKVWEGHFEGAKRFEEIVNKGFECGVKTLTFWGSSMDNLTKRPVVEKKALLEVYEEYFHHLIEDDRIFTDKIKINIVGHWRKQFPARLKKLLEDGIEKTKSHRNYTLNFLLAYNGDDDILTGVRRIIERNYRAEEVDGQLIKKELLSGDVEMVDLVIRTGVENDPHNSAGFLMWQTQNSQYYFTDTYFPDFNAEKFDLAIADFQKRERRLGK